MVKQEYNYWMSSIPNIGPKKIELLLNVFGNAEEVFQTSRDNLEKVIERARADKTVRFVNSDLDNIIHSKDKEKIHRNYCRLLERGIQFISKEEEAYPDKLRSIYSAPYALYVKGKLPARDRKMIAIVGARNCSVYGIEITRYMAKALAAEGVAIISGMARGIDTYAHRGALEADGITYAILGCGIDICYPKENIMLYMDAQKKGAIISEYAPGIQPLAGNFPMRNRIISGLSDGILVIEAKEKSGSLITVDMGLEQGKEIYALPGRITDTLSRGCLNLIKMGAKTVTSPEDILEDLLLSFQSNPDVKNAYHAPIQLEPEEKRVFDSLGMEPMHIEFISQITGLSMEQLMEPLLKLELKSAIKQPMKNYYIRAI